jgi:hypothetical protein
MECNSIYKKIVCNVKIQTLALGNKFSMYIIAFHFSMLKAFYPIEIKSVML